MNRRELLASLFVGIIPRHKDTSEEPAYVFNGYNTLRETKPKRVHCIFTYRKGQDTSKIVNNPVLVFNTKDELDYFINSFEGKEFFVDLDSRKATYVIREITLYN